MRRRNRERIEAIRAGLAKPFKAAGGTFKDIGAAASGDPIARSRLEDRVMKGAGLSREVTTKNVATACKLMEGLIKIQGVKALQGQIQSHLPSEIAQVLASGRDPFDFYWSITEFRNVWTKLSFTEETLRVMIEEARKSA